MEKNWKYYNDIKAIIKKIYSFKSIVIYDTETTGFSKDNDRIIQFSAIRYEIPSWNELNRLDLYIKAPFKINDSEASKVNGITDELLEEKGVSEIDAFYLIKDFIKEDDLVSGYNIAFDKKFMDALYNRYKQLFKFKDTIDVYPFSKYIVPAEAVLVEKTREKDGKTITTKEPSYKLGIVTQYYDKDNTFKFHSSIEDVEATAFVLKSLIENAEQMMNDFEEQEKKRSDIPRNDAKVLSISLFNPSKNIKRVYVNTTQGTVYYDEIRRTWNAKKKGVIDAIDIEGVVKKVFEQIGVSEEKDLYKQVEWREKVKKAEIIFEWNEKTYTKEILKKYRDSLLLEIDFDEKEPENKKEKRKTEIRSAYNTLVKEYFKEAE